MRLKDPGQPGYDPKKDPNYLVCREYPGGKYAVVQAMTYGKFRINVLDSNYLGYLDGW